MIYLIILLTVFMTILAMSLCRISADADSRSEAAFRQMQLKAHNAQPKEDAHAK